MKISQIKFRNFKRFTDLTINGIPPQARLVVLVGPNGSGKSSVFDGLNQWYRMKCNLSWLSDAEYYFKSEAGQSRDWYRLVDVSFHDVNPQDVNKGSMYFRTAYRNDPDFRLDRFERVGAPYETPTFNRAIDNDQAVSRNYQRLVHKTLTGVYSPANGEKTVRQLRDELIGKVKDSMSRVFEDLTLNDIGDPLGEGTFFFKKGVVDSFPYKNLSSGEKAAFDILLDLILKLEYYPNALFFIEEPEAHMHTTLQGRLLEEMFRVIPPESQLWITTHALGVMHKARELAHTQPDSVVFLDFSGHDFDGPTTITPASIDGLVWEKLLSIALGDFRADLAPEIIVLCEGTMQGTQRKNFDAQIYRRILGAKYPQIVFVPGGSCTELEQPDHMGYQLLKNVLRNTKVLRLIDRDDRSDAEVAELKRSRILVTSRRSLESYLFDDEILEKLVRSRGQDPSHVQAVLQAKANAIAETVQQGRPCDDIKAAAGRTYVEIKRILSLTQIGSSVEAFMRDTLAPLVSEDTNVFREMEAEIVEPILRA